MHSKLGISCLDMVLDSVAGEIETVCNTIDRLTLVVEFHDPLLSFRQLGVELRHTDYSFKLALPSQRAMYLLKVEDSMLIIVVRCVKVSEVAFQESADTQEVQIRLV